MENHGKPPYLEGNRFLDRQLEGQPVNARHPHQAVAQTGSVRHQDPLQGACAADLWLWQDQPEINHFEKWGRFPLPAIYPNDHDLAVGFLVIICVFNACCQHVHNHAWRFSCEICME